MSKVFKKLVFFVDVNNEDGEDVSEMIIEKIRENKGTVVGRYELENISHLVWSYGDEELLGWVKTDPDAMVRRRFIKA